MLGAGAGRTDQLYSKLLNYSSTYICVTTAPGTQALFVCHTEGRKNCPLSPTKWFAELSSCIAMGVKPLIVSRHRPIKCARASRRQVFVACGRDTPETSSQSTSSSSKSTVTARHIKDATFRKQAEHAANTRDDQ